MERPYVGVRRELASRVLRVLKELGLLDRSCRPIRKEGLVLFPLVREPHEDELEVLEEKLGRVEVGTADFRPREKPRRLLDVLSGSLPGELMDLVPRSFDVVGDVAIIELPEPLWPYRSLVGSAIMAVHKKVRLVLAKGGPVSGEFRLRELVPIAGSGPTETVHREHGCIFRLDVAKVYFSPRLSFEHARVASQVREDEVILDMFAGVGPFSILAAKRAGSVLAYAVDVNPWAFHYLAQNVALNKVRGCVVPVLSDAREAVRSGLEGLANRVIMNLPEKAHEFLDAACEALRPEGGVIHFYTFAGAPEPEQEALRVLEEGVGKAGRSVRKILAVRKVRAVGPFRWQVVVDAEIA